MILYLDPNQCHQCVARWRLHSLVADLLQSLETEHESTSTSTCAISSYFAEDTSDTDKAKYACSFHPDSNKFRWAKVLKKGPLFALCTVCSRDVIVAYGGMKDLKRHEPTKVHQ